MGRLEKEPIIGVYPASFDPITIAHVSIAERAARVLDELFIAVAVNPDKKYLFPADVKVRLVEESTAHIDNASVISLSDGFTVDHARELGARTLIRGARSVTDFLDEINLFGANTYAQSAIGLGPEADEFVDTQTYYALPGQDGVSSSIVRTLVATPNVMKREERIRPLVPDPVFEEIQRTLLNRK